MAFRIKNITDFRVSILGINLTPRESVDLTQTLSNAQIRASLLSGELYHKIQGRQLAVLSPAVDINSIGLTTAEIARLTHAGFFQGFLGYEELKPPFSFDSDGYLYVAGLSGGGGSVTGQVSVRGIIADGLPADNFPVEVGGVDIAGNVQSLFTSPEGYLTGIGPVIEGGAAYNYPIQIGGVDAGGNIRSAFMTLEGFLTSVGPVADGAAAYGFPVEMGGVDVGGNVQSIFVSPEGFPVVVGPSADGTVAYGYPVEMGGVDGNGLVQSLSVNVDGYLNVAGTATSTFGPVADGNPAYGFPVEVGGVDLNGNVQSLLVDSDGYLMTSTAISIEVNSEVEGRVFDGTSAAGIKPVIIAGVDEAGLAQTLLVDSDGYLMTSTAISIETTAEVEGRVLDSASAAGIKPVTIAGVYVADPTASTLTDGDAGNVLLNDQRMPIVENRVYDSASDADKTIPVFIAQDRYVFEDFSGTRADSDATFNYYADMQGYSYFSLQNIFSGDGYKTLTVNASNQDGNDITALTYSDITADYFGSASFDDSCWLERDTVCSCKALRIDIAISNMNPGDTAVWAVYFAKKTA